MKKTGFIILLIVCLLLSGCYYSKKTNDYEKYRQYSENNYYASFLMPTTDGMGNYKKMTATHKRVGTIFVVETVGLFLEYDEATYKEQIEYIDENYSFFEESPNPEYLDIDATVNGYTIKTVNKTEGFDYGYRISGGIYQSVIKHALLIGFNEAENKICFLFRDDDELDLLDDLENHITQYFYMV